MFSFFQSRQTHEATEILKRLCDATTDRESSERHNRSSVRQSRKIPVVIVPYDGDPHGSGASKMAITALATDISNDGVGLVCRHHLEATDLILGFLLALPQAEYVEFFRGQVRHREPMGAGYYQLGVQVTEHLTAREHPLVAALNRVALAMLPDRSPH